jgi:formamidopyrimidine-DNA glycosylase
MPELPEVETTRRGIAPHVAGKRIERVTVYDSRLRWPVPEDIAAKIEGRAIDAIERRSKYLLFRLGAIRGDEPPRAANRTPSGDSEQGTIASAGAHDTLVFHFGMTGSLRFHRNPPARKPHDHVDIVLDDGTLLRYHDPRRFGAMLFVEGTAADHPLLAHLGPEPFDAAFDARYLRDALRTRTAAIKLALMDNSVVVGVGNIYASEALFRAGIRPATSARKVSLPRISRLVDAVRAVLSSAIESGGSTLRDYVDAGGRPGRAQHGHFVYGRQGAPCRVCRTPIKMRRLGARASYYCPTCQR